MSAEKRWFLRTSGFQTTLGVGLDPHLQKNMLLRLPTLVLAKSRPERD